MLTLATSSGFPPIFATRPYVCVAIGFLTSLFTKPLLGLGGGHRRQILQILQIHSHGTLTYSCSPGTENIIKFKPEPDIDVEDLADKTDVNATSAIKLNLEIPSDSFVNFFCRQVLKRNYGQMMQEAEIKLNDDTFFILQVLVQIDQVIKPSNSQSLTPTVLSTIICSSVPSVGPSGIPNCFLIPSLKPSHLSHTMLSLSPLGTPSLDASMEYLVTKVDLSVLSQVLFPVAYPILSNLTDPSVSSICLIQQGVQSLRNKSTVDLTSLTTSLFWRRTLIGSMTVACQYCLFLFKASAPSHVTSLSPSIVPIFIASLDPSYFTHYITCSVPSSFCT